MANERQVRLTDAAHHAEGETKGDRSAIGFAESVEYVLAVEVLALGDEEV